MRTNTRSKVLLFGSESCGLGDEDLGYQLMVDLLKVLANRQDGIKAIIFWNTAVRLVATGSPVIPQLKRLEEQGVEILAGIMCLEDLGLIDKIAVGKPTTMPKIAELLLHSEVITL